MVYLIQSMSNLFVVTRNNIPFRVFTLEEDADLYIERKVKINHDHCCACEHDLYWHEHRKEWDLPKWERKLVNVINSASSAESDSEEDDEESTKDQYTYDDQNIIIFLIYSHNTSHYTNKEDVIASAHYSEKSAINSLKDLSSSGSIKYKIKVCKYSESCLYDPEDISRGYGDISEYRDDGRIHHKGYYS
jgi:hypothetical protein